MNAQCDCRERHAATQNAELFYWAEREGWVFTNGPMRRLTRGAAYWKGERAIDDHTGEMFVWVDCPFCGLELPKAIVPEAKWKSDAAGGDDGG